MFAAEQSPDGLAGDLAEDVPERDVDAGDHVRDRPAAALPEGLLVQRLAGGGGIDGAGADEERLDELKRLAPA